MNRIRFALTGILVALAVAVALAFPAVGMAATTPVTAYGKNCSTTQFTYSYGSTVKKVAVSNAKGLCIDVSHWDNTIDWTKVKKAGVEYAIIACGWYKDGWHTDPQWEANVLGAKEAGIKFGVYVYSYAYSEGMARTESKSILKCLEDTGVTPEDLALPVYMDLEEKFTNHGGTPTKIMYGRMAAIWCNTIAAAGYNVGVYSGAYFWRDHLTSKVFSQSGWSKWVADYYYCCKFCQTDTGAIAPISTYKNYLDLWQFTESGRFTKGAIKTGVDLNYIFNDEFNTAYTKVKVPGADVIYCLNGGTNKESNVTSYSETEDGTLELANPTRKGYAFKGWYTTRDFVSSTKVTSVSKTTDSKVTLYAKWQVKSFKVSYKLGGGTNNSKNKTKYTCAENPVKFYSPKRAGYKFRGWYTTADYKSGTKVGSSFEGAGNKSYTLYAKWQIVTYKISYVLDGGVLPEDAVESYQITTPTITLSMPTKEGCGFVGWYGNSDLTGSQITKISKGSVGKKTLYAKWVEGGFNAPVVADKLPVYQKKDDSSDVVTTLKKGKVVCISKTSADGIWGKVYGKGWIKLEGIQVPEAEQTEE